MPDDRRTDALLAAAALCLGLGLALSFGRCADSARRVDAPARGRVSPSDLAAVNELAALGVDEIVDLLESPEGEPAALTLVEEILRDSKFRARWEELARRRLTTAPGALVRELRGDPQFAALLKGLVRRPEFARAIKPALASRAEGEGGGAQASRILVVGGMPAERGEASRRGESPASSSGGRSKSEAESRARLSRSAVGVPARRGAARESAGAAARLSDGARPPPSGGTAGGGAHDVPTALGAIAPPSSELMRKLLEMYPWLGALSASQRADVAQATSADGLWGACFHLGVYKPCADACLAAGGSCVLVDGWRACLEYKDQDAAACRTLCPRQPGCMPPAAGGAAGGAVGGAAGLSAPPAPGSCLAAGAVCGKLDYECGWGGSYDHCGACCNGTGDHDQTGDTCPNVAPDDPLYNGDYRPHVWTYHCD